MMPSKRRIRRNIQIKTMPAIDVRVVAARAKIEQAKVRYRSWRGVAIWLGDVSKATACNRLSKDKGFRPSVALVELIEQTELAQPEFVGIGGLRPATRDRLNALRGDKTWDAFLNELAYLAWSAQYEQQEGAG